MDAFGNNRVIKVLMVIELEMFLFFFTENGSKTEKYILRSVFHYSFTLYLFLYNIAIINPDRKIF